MPHDGNLVADPLECRRFIGGAGRYDETQLIRESGRCAAAIAVVATTVTA